jgi:hypothetical protein
MNEEKILLHIEDVSDLTEELQKIIAERQLNIKIDSAKTLKEALNKLIALSKPDTPRYAGIILDAGLNHVVKKEFEFNLKNGKEVEAQIEIKIIDNEAIRGVLLLTRLLEQGYYHCHLPIAIASNNSPNYAPFKRSINQLETLLMQCNVESKLELFRKTNPTIIVNWIEKIANSGF